MPPKPSAFPSSFSLTLTYTPAKGDQPAELRTQTVPEHNRIDAYCAVLARLAPLLKLPTGDIKAVAQVGKNRVSLLPGLVDAPLQGFLSELVLIGVDDLAEMRRQAEGYPYERIADAYVDWIRTARRTRRVLPKIEMDRSPFLPMTVMNVMGGPAVTIRTSKQRDVIRLRGIPFNQPFARLANEHIEDTMRQVLSKRLPVLGRLSSPRT